MSESLHKFVFAMFGGPNELQFYSSAARAEVIFELVKAELKRIEHKYSRFLPTSTLSEINQSAGSGTSIKVDEETAALLDFADLCFEQSGGVFDISSGVLSRTWNFKERKVPTSERIAEVMPLVGWKKLKWKKPNLALPVKGMEIDFGGFGKEYATDRAATLLIENGVSRGLVNLGGDLRVLGPHPDGSPWHIGIAHPRDENSVLTTVMLMDGALATSGDYERFFEIDGKRFSHIINPRTGMPVDSFQSVSVIAQSCLIGGSAATIAMLLGEKAGVEFLKELGVSYILAGKDGSIRRFKS